MNERRVAHSQNWMAVAVPPVLSALLGALAAGILLAVVVPMTVGRVSVAAAMAIISLLTLGGAVLGVRLMQLSRGGARRR
jgi:predicted lipid-binding transport protein (Tim44 family)